jgi:hypothetical protein
MALVRHGSTGRCHVPCTRMLVYLDAQRMSWIGCSVEEAKRFCSFVAVCPLVLPSLGQASPRFWELWTKNGNHGISLTQTNVLGSWFYYLSVCHSFAHIFIVFPPPPFTPVYANIQSTVKMKLAILATLAASAAAFTGTPLKTAVSTHSELPFHHCMSLSLSFVQKLTKSISLIPLP